MQKFTNKNSKKEKLSSFFFICVGLFLAILVHPHDFELQIRKNECDPFNYCGIPQYTPLVDSHTDKDEVLGCLNVNPETLKMGK